MIISIRKPPKLLKNVYASLLPSSLEGPLCLELLFPYTNLEYSLEIRHSKNSCRLLNAQIFIKGIKFLLSFRIRYENPTSENL